MPQTDPGQKPDNVPRCEYHDRDEVFFDPDLRCECCLICREDGRTGELTWSNEEP